MSFTDIDVPSLLKSALEVGSPGSQTADEDDEHVVQYTKPMPKESKRNSESEAECAVGKPVQIGTLCQPTRLAE